MNKNKEAAVLVDEPILFRSSSDGLDKLLNENEYGLEELDNEKFRFLGQYDENDDDDYDIDDDENDNSAKIRARRIRQFLNNPALRRRIDRQNNRRYNRRAQQRNAHAKIRNRKMDFLFNPTLRRTNRRWRNKILTRPT